jgi:hypothetical protein
MGHRHRQLRGIIPQAASGKAPEWQQCTCLLFFFFTRRGNRITVIIKGIKQLQCTGTTLHIPLLCGDSGSPFPYY